MNIFSTLSTLLLYPESEWLPFLPALQAEVATDIAGDARMQADFAALFAHLGTDDLIALQERYVATFDRNPSHSLHLFEHIHGESRDRGQAMVDLLQEYKRHGLEMVGGELPDYVPLFLEFLAQLPTAEALKMLGNTINVLAHIGRKLATNHSPYAVVFALLEKLSPTVAEPLTDAPAREMDEAMQFFGPSGDGVEPLLKLGLQTIKFYPRQPASQTSTPQ